MPAIMVCPHCKVQRNLGFMPIVGGITLFWHYLDGMPERQENTHSCYEVNGQWFTSKKEAWTEARKTLTDSDENWLKAWDAVMVDGTPDLETHKRYLDKWKASLGV